MTGELEQCICLCSFANAILAAPKQSSQIIASVPASAFSHVGVVRFDHASVAGQDAFLEWTNMLQKLKSRRLWLGATARQQFLSSHVAEAFANANPRSITAETSSGFIGWTTSWDFQPSKSWTVTFTQIETPRPPVSWDLDACFANLQSSISEIRDFAARIAESHWQTLFEKALRALNTNTRNSRLPEFGYDIQAHAIMNGAASAWVFGGMGSWNDLWFDDEKLLPKYNEVTERLYNAIIGSVMTSVNSFDASKTRT
jgi:hypothetical protein